MAILVDRVGHMRLTADDLGCLLSQVCDHFASHSDSDKLIESSSVE